MPNNFAAGFPDQPVGTPGLSQLTPCALIQVRQEEVAAIPACAGPGGICLDFQLNDEQLQLQKSVREFAQREIAPHVMGWDEAGEFPLATIKELGKLTP